MKSVLISIKPKWCELIASGEKTVEVRKTRPKLETPFKVYIYCTRQKVNGEILLTYDKKVEGRNRGFRDEGDIPLAGKVIGEFVCNKVEDYSKFEYDYCALLRHIELFAKTKSYFFLDSYLDGKKCCYGWHITDLVIYDKPRELSEFKRDCDGNCQSCKYAIWQTNGWAYEPYIADCKPITRPPQSWCYVESEGEG